MNKEPTPAPEPRPLGRTNSGSAIVFDPVAQRITTEKVSRLENHKPIKTAPKWFNHVEIFDEDNLKRHVVTLNLGKLSWTTNMKRLCGKCNDIYIMELPDQPAASIAMAA